tara:strand:+ start:163 stop:330 length:168 start_codon:yes stop_codon:yes gene_type:complete
MNTKSANKYIRVISKGQKKRGSKPISSIDLELLLLSIGFDKEHFIRTICILSVDY